MRDPEFILILGGRGTGKTTDCFELINRKLTTKQNRVLLIDDCRRVIKSNVQGYFNELFIDLRHRMIDLVLVAHGITQVPPSFFVFVNKIILHKTTDSPLLRKRELGDMYESFCKQQQTVNEKCIKNPYAKTIFNFS